MRTLLLAMAILFAGCASTAPAGPEAPATPPVLPSAYELVCPPGGVDTAGVCALRITSFTETNQEPFVAVHPTDPSIVAIGVNAGHTTEGVSDHGEVPGFDMVRLDIFITEDAGQAWRRSTLPYVEDPAVTVEPLHASVIGDPALEFDAAGTLHVSGIASHSQVRGYNVFYTQSPDLGRSWSTPVVLSEGDGNDRNWLNIGPDGTLYVPWQEVGGPSWVAWSTDDGLSWQKAEADCFTISEMAFLGDDAFFACTRSDQGYHVVVHRLASGTVEVLARSALSCVWPKLNVAGNSTLFLSGEGCDGSQYTTSRNGSNWTDPAPLADIAPGAVMWQTDDPWGRIHLLMAQGGAKRYVVYDVAAGEVLQRIDLPSEPTQAGAPETIAPAYGDHYWGIDVKEHGGAMVWTRQDNLDVSFLAPSFPA